MITIIDYDAGNLKSVEKALNFIGQKTIITREKEEILKAEKVILPGVGSFGTAMDKLYKYDLVDTIREITDKKTPLLGICLGLQLLFGASEESPEIQGMSILDGEIIKIPDTPGLKIPHMGWNSLGINPKSKLFQGIEDNSYVYFVHSYYLKAKNINEVAATTDYGTLIHASIEKDNIYACQFHPEKSGEVGLQILKNFALI
ncbi:glutamine amidotransferase [Mobilisporobacter senegalensis]|uniref:Imidazole glycerol phosphate synthase subunit HisH n=1 Tax=Mobilisporobacter senegalensis TaxID=1329262 RepID=A0A3N1XS56_9FIRM|nr:imidazole glycerol phosphate synthase subunit HisH [Mobilisporobacter senegalensis]ROR29466.1 glutamine amidotransferase [Mobilisporobacter senegalensis]